jgi:hypothetical protein
MNLSLGSAVFIEPGLEMEIAERKEIPGAEYC